MYNQLESIACIILGTFLIFISGCNTTSTAGSPTNEPLREEIYEIVEKIAEVNIVMDKAVGYSGERPEQYDNFIELKTKATRDELIGLTDHENPTVRCYAFWALTDDNTVEILPIIISHINDNEYVTAQFGCIGYSERVGDFFIRIAKLSPGQLAELDRILINTPNELYARAAAIDRAEPSKDLYARLRELYIRTNDQTALVKLAQYQKEQDIELILSNREESKFEEGGFFYTYRAISYFPHPAFLPLLEENLRKTLDNTHYSSEWKELYRAIARYQNHKALELLRVPLTQVIHANIRKYHIDFMFAALGEFKAPIYIELLWQLWEEGNRIKVDIFEYLYEDNPQKALKLSKISLQRINDRNISGNIKIIMLDFVLEMDRDFAFGIIKENIRKANVHQFPIIADKVDEIKDRYFVKPLLERFEEESNPHVYLRIAKTLIGYKDEEINQRILEAREKNESLNKGWGGEALDRILEENFLE